LNAPRRPATVLRADGAGVGGSGVTVARFGTTGRTALLGIADRIFEASGFAGAVVCGFSTTGARGFSVRDACGIFPSRPAS